MNTKKELSSTQFKNEQVRDIFYKQVLHNMRRNLYCKFRCFDPATLTEEDVRDIENALYAELGRSFTVEPKKAITHISPDGFREYNRRKKEAQRIWGWDVPDDWYDRVAEIEEDYDDGVWYDGYPSEEAFWECNGI